jgi:hypothetical protein
MCFRFVNAANARANLAGFKLSPSMSSDCKHCPITMPRLTFPHFDHKITYPSMVVHLWIAICLTQWESDLIGGYA